VGVPLLREHAMETTNMKIAIPAKILDIGLFILSSSCNRA
jgi:hypothetical protein